MLRPLIFRFLIATVVSLVANPALHARGGSAEITNLILNDEPAGELKDYYCLLEASTGVERCELTWGERIFVGDLITPLPRALQENIVVEFKCGESLVSLHENFEAYFERISEESCDLEVEKGTADILTAQSVKVRAGGTLIGTAGTHFSVSVYPEADPDYRFLCQLFEGRLNLENPAFSEELTQGNSFDPANGIQPLAIASLEALAKANARSDLARAWLVDEKLTRRSLELRRPELEFLHFKTLSSPSSLKWRRELSALQMELGLVFRAEIGLKQRRKRIDTKEPGQESDSGPRSPAEDGAPKSFEDSTLESLGQEVETPAGTSSAIGPFHEADPTEPALDRIRLWAKREGTVWLALPTRRWFGETISGTLSFTVEGNKKRRMRELERMKVRIGEAEVPVAEGDVAFQLPRSGPAVIQLLNKRGRLEDQKPFKILGKPLPAPEPRAPRLCARDKPIVITGPFDGLRSTTTVRQGSVALEVLGESPRELILLCPDGAISITERGQRYELAPIHQVEVRVHVSDNDLRSGERATARLEIKGLDGYRHPFAVRLENTSSDVVRIAGKQIQIFNFKPRDWERDGSVAETLNLRGRRRGSSMLRTT
ncbi:MAG: hypothetical protein AAFX50_06770, partial [Acidobacteriota bacterium]